MGALSSDCQQKKAVPQGAFLPLEKKTKIYNPLKPGKVLMIAGPTACGKTDLSLLLAELLKGEIISCDSMQIYRGMDIGTAKVSAEEQQKIPHHLIDIRAIHEPFNVVDFFYEATQCVDSILARDRVPILVGGTGFYFRTFLHGPPCGPPSIPEVRHALEEEMRTKGPDALYARLEAQDPKYAQTITVNDKHKVIRALEILCISGEKVSSLNWEQTHLRPGYQYHGWFLHRSREKLYQDINRRCDVMLDKGFLDEVKRLDQEGLKLNSSASQAIGYRQALEYLAGEPTQERYDHFVSEFKKASRNYAKRQFTWFKKEHLFQWLDLELHDKETAAEMIAQAFQSHL